jgi:tetratricopeptide (TPR) repeat protein
MTAAPTRWPWPLSAERAAVVRAVAQLYRDNDYRDVTPALITELLTVGKTTWTNQFGGKRPLLLAAVRQVWEDYPKRAARQACTVTDARQAATHAFRQVGEFLMAERSLATALVFSLGDYSPHEKKPNAAPWPGESGSGPWPDLFAAGRMYGRWIGFGDFLAEQLGHAAQCVGHLDAQAHLATGQRMSDLVLRMWWQDLDQSVDQIVRQAVGCWFDGDLVPATGLWVRWAEDAERAIARVDNRSDLVAERMGAQLNLGTALAAGQTLWIRARRELQTAVAMASELALPGGDSDLLGAIVADAKSRRALAAYRYGDLQSALETLESELAVTRAVPRHLARVRTNLAEVYLRVGRIDDAAALVAAAQRDRPLADARNTVPQLWHAATTTAIVAVRVELAAGRARRALQVADDLVAHLEGDRGQELVHTGPTAAMVWAVRGRARRAVGNPVDGAADLRRAVAIAAQRCGRGSLLGRHIRLEIARCSLDAGHPDEALNELTELARDEQWVLTNMSFRHALATRMWLGIAHLHAGEPDTALTIVQHGITMLDDYRLARGDQLLVAYTATLARLERETGDLDEALKRLQLLTGRGLSDSSWPTRLRVWSELARSYVAARRPARAVEILDRASTEAREAGVDPTHPLLIASRGLLEELKELRVE